jgi:hypothetical protein
MPLSADERARIIETQVLKTEIESALASGKAGPKLNDFSKQVILLVLGFVFTTLAGGLLTYCWKQREWHNQQAYLAQQRALDRKYAVIDRTFKEVALTTAAAEDILSSYYSENVTQKYTTERLDNWHKTSRDWRVASRVLSASHASNFLNPDIGKTFKEIINKRKQLGIAITNLPDLKPGANVSEETRKELENANDLVNQIGELLQECGALMTIETRTNLTP